MDLSSLVHTGRTHNEQQYHQQEPQPRHTMVSSLVMSPYMAHDYSKSTYTYASAPKPPPSPPADETPKCSLPSISSLLVYVDTSSSQGPCQVAQPYGYNREFNSSKSAPVQAHQSNYFDSGHPKYSASSPISSRRIFPLTPPLHSNSGFDGSQSSPSAISISGSSVSSVSNYEPVSSSAPEFPKLCKAEPLDQHPYFDNKASLLTKSRPRSQSTTNGSGSHYRTSSHQRLNPFHPTSIQHSRSTSSEASGLSYQRPLQQYPPPSSIQVPTSSSQFSPANPWQHHHYISPSSAASFPQTQDRYICQTCNKAFSRPSSLRIHSHSHTGAKPFKCPHLGCGKAFSVRSNMKRHERGCHSSEG